MKIRSLVALFPLLIIACGISTLPVANVAPTDMPTQVYQSTTETPTYQSASVTAYSVYVRYAPAGRRIGVLSLGDTVSISACYNGWCKTSRGWLWQGCLSLNPQELGCKYEN